MARKRITKAATVKAKAADPLPPENTSEVVTDDSLDWETFLASALAERLRADQALDRYNAGDRSVELWAEFGEK